MDASVILCGTDATLLATRKLVLERAGLCVRTVSSVQDVAELQGDALILCYSLSLKEQQEAACRFRAKHPRARVLVLGGDVRIGMFPECETLTAYPGPQSLIEKARSLVM